MLLEHPRTWVEVDLKRIKNNYRAAMARLHGETAAIAVIKSDAYGHGYDRVGRALFECGVRRFAVASIDEAVALRECEWLPRECEVLILGYTPPALLDELCEYGITQPLISEDYAAELASRIVARHCGKIRTHLALDTGMRRVGEDCENIVGLTDLVARYKSRLGIDAVFTHLCCADGESPSDKEFTGLQLKRFSAAYRALRPLGISEAHCLNSAGILWHSRSVCDELSRLVRPGIVLYGLSPNGGSLPKDFTPALTWKTEVAMVKTVHRGESIGYGRAFTAPRDMLVATLPVGYADGYPRALSNKGFVMIRGNMASVLGRVCMNQMMVEVSDVEGVCPGDEAVLLGGKANADRLAGIAGTIGYELITRISPYVPRFYL